VRRVVWPDWPPPSERAKAAGAPIEVDIAYLKPGEMKIFEWRSKPVRVPKRTTEMTASLNKTSDKVADQNLKSCIRCRCGHIARTSIVREKSVKIS
jgi:Rieske Fe-S protein